ncbi:MAG: TonB-dependent receptor [Saprospiraceae bacterium]|nr:TonB-dependent receptor [Saprospiraceae bacterium]
MKKRLLAALLLSSTLHLFAQNNLTGGKVSGSVLDDQAKPLEFVTVTLHRLHDSVFVKGAITDEKGFFEMNNLKWGRYFIRITHMGFSKFSSSEVSITESTPSVFLEKINLKNSTTTLGAVTVEARKPFVERKLDRLVVNVENSIVSAGSSAYEVLERSPNVFINQESSINLKGKSGVIVMFDGKPTPLSGADLIQYLKSIPSANIEKIELITNPSARYDAAGNAGIIDIKFKKDKRLGFNGSLAVSDGQGFYNKFNASTNLNYRTKMWNLYGSYAYGQPNSFTRFSINRKFFKTNKEVEAIFDQNSFTKQPIESHNVRLGADYFASKKTVIGFMVNTNLNNSDRNGFTNSTITNPLRQVQYTTEMNNILNSRNRNGFVNGNLKHSFDSTGRELTLDVDYGQYDAKTFQNVETNNFNTNHNLLSSNTLETDQNGLITVKSAKVDYVHPLKNKAKFEAGAKSSFVKTDNDIKFYDVIDNKNILDDKRSNHFIYDENVNAAYVNYAQEFTKFDIQMGLRMEHTVTNGQQITTGQKFSRNYVSWFPSAVINRKISANHQLSLSYSRRIDRPSYRQLNPFRIFVDPYTYVVGDPELKPVFTHAFELSHTFKGRYITELSYSKTKDVITDVFVQDDATRVSNQIPANLQDLDAVSLSLTIPFSIQKWLNSNLTGGLNWGKYVSPLQGGNLVNENKSWDVRLQNSIGLGKKGWSAELTGFYQSRLVWGLFTIRDLGQLTAGVQKLSKDKKTTFRFNISDIVLTNHVAVIVQYQNMDFFTDRTWDSRVATLSISHRFGKQTVQQARRRNSGVEDEKRRAT